ncbi:C2 domain-containing protein [Chytriomyces sp. MP71]|nr:C2 domain-containing protein [Chytriomyces sp. MP71]
MFPIDLEVSMGFIPLEVSLTHTTRNSGTLYVDLISASNLEAVDHSGTSDPYVLVSLNGEPLHKSKVHKKELNPVFNESIRAAIKSRQSSSLEFVVKDFNAIGKHVTLGTASADLSLMIPDQLQNMTLPLAGARSGTLTVKLFFDHKTGVAATPDSAAPLTRIGDDDSNAAMKMTKGIGQAQENGVSAAQIAMDQGAEVTDIIPAVDGSDNSSLASVSVSGTLNLTILAARNLKAVDDNGLADPFVMVNQLLHGKVKTLLKTKSKSKNLNPEWNESVQFKIPPSKITIVVLDKNLFGASKPMGEVEVNLQDLIDAGNAFDTWIQVSLGGMGEIHVRGEFYSDGGLAPPSVGLAGRSSFASNANSRTPSPADDEGSEHGTGGVGMFKRNASSLGGLFKAKRAS